MKNGKGGAERLQVGEMEVKRRAGGHNKAAELIIDL